MEKTFKSYRFEKNPKEKEMVDKFIEEIDTIESRVFGKLSNQSFKLNSREEKIVYSTIQWLGSSVGQNYLKSSGFKLEE